MGKGPAGVALFSWQPPGYMRSHTGLNLSVFFANRPVDSEHNGRNFVGGLSFVCLVCDREPSDLSFAVVAFAPCFLTKNW